MECRACGLTMAGEARFCSQCGARLEGPATPRIDEGSRSRVMSTLRGEERLVTVVFADLTESVRRTADLSPEEATGLVNPLLETMVELTLRYDGRIDRFLGDGVLAVFGVPSTHEDDPMRAVRAAVELRERAATMGLAVTIGINTGRVYFGPVGSSLHEELTVMGPTVNLAARLQSAASSDEILIGESTRTHVEAAFHLVPVTVPVKGIDQPVEAYRTEYQVDHPEKVRGIRGLRADLVGRDAAIETLRDVLDSAPSTVALIGPAGVGKSRLAAEMNRLAAERNATWMEGRCREDTMGVQYGPVIDMLRRRFGVSQTAKGLLASLHEQVEAGVLDVDRATEMAPFLAHLLGETIGDDTDLRVTESNADRRRHLTVGAMVDYLGASARLNPTVLLLDDMHWSDDASLEVVQAAHGFSADTPLVLAVAIRPDPDAPTHGLVDRLGKNLTTLHLGELTGEECKLLIQRLLDVSGIPASLEERIVANSGGNPFYVEEILRTFMQRGVIVHQGDRWEASGALESIPVPESVEGLLLSRFDRLPTYLKHAARVASVLGPEFTESQLEAMDESLSSELGALVDAGLTALLREGDDNEYGFLHALTHRSIYDSLLPSHRSELHGRAGEALEGSGSDDVESLAHHYGHSQNDGKAVEYLLAAAERALASYANDIARRQLEGGLARIDRLPPDQKDRWRGRYRARLGELLERQADHDRARTELTGALDELGEDPPEQARLLCLIGRTHRLQRDFDAAHDCYDKAERALERLEARDSRAAHRTWVEIQQERSHALYFGGRGRELAEHNARLQPIVEAYGTVAQQVDLRRAIAMDGFVRHRFLLDKAAVEHARHTLELAMAGADPGRISETRFVFGFTLLWADEIEEAVATLSQAVAGAARVGDVVHECRARSYHAVALRRSGSVDEAEAAAIDAFELAASLDDSYYQGHALATRCWVGWSRDDGTCKPLGEDAYRAWGEHVQAEYSGIGTEFAWMAAWPLAADAHDRGDLDDALGHLRKLRVPWERHMPTDLVRAVDGALDDGGPDTFARAVDLARHHRLL